MRKKAAPGERIFIVRSRFGDDLVSANTAREAAERHVTSRKPEEGGWVCVREGSGREERFNYTKPRSKK